MICTGTHPTRSELDLHPSALGSDEKMPRRETTLARGI